VDRVVLELANQGDEIDRAAKERLLGILAEETTVGGQSGPLMVQLHRFATSLLRCYEGQGKKLAMPEFVEKSGTDSQTGKDSQESGA